MIKKKRKKKLSSNKNSMNIFFLNFYDITITEKQKLIKY